ncbi:MULTISPECIES: isopenicillin N synthase family dioxygenase [Ramlibacter]|uniref:2-oxoglutarate-dependent ethylene/succinate-forming enzyme n=1 Tax=Ramlibacter pinisoli TaxID=2682844 RepID=A0A6N8ISI3_9BURK|nr:MULTISPECIES: 2-oxoglutarate and iron-dependent oxygenase domain-containing protein [Ramlibacter]MBA2964080.1 isopenicillin N synthase family oxygenase [Ramlibacter sp. CGMCC 1.13660]MVQ29046.1 isopenicillin N synthase family oxygenase [Ramlibacter pinisoli]
MSIPILDLQGALSRGGPRSAEVARQLRAAAVGSGFFYVRNHGVAAQQVARQFELARQLLEDVPPGTRERLDMKNSPTLRGYERLGAQTLDLDAKPDLKESFYCGMAYPADHPYVRAGYQTYGGNQWPAQVPQAPAVCEAYIRSLLALARRLMQLLALSLALPEDYFDGTSESPMVTLRMLRYPAHPPDADQHTFGAGAHTDWGAITILAQDSHGGLEVCMPDGTWADATPIDGCFVVNLGDMIPRWTNGLYHSNPHRVRNRHSSGRPRFSVPFFYEPDYMARIEAVPGTVPAGEQPRFTPCTAGEHLAEMYRRTYGKPAEGTPA